MKREVLVSLIFSLIPILILTFIIIVYDESIVLDEEQETINETQKREIPKILNTTKPPEKDSLFDSEQEDNPNVDSNYNETIEEIDPYENFWGEHGNYSLDYLSNWSILKEGNQNKKKIDENNFYFVNGEDGKKTYTNETITIKDLALKINWNNSYDKYNTALYLIRNCSRVIIDNVSIIQANWDYRSSSAIFIQGCNEVIINNSYFSGTTDNNHIRIEGSEKIFIDNIEISGYNYGEKGIRSGGGIFINNGQGENGTEGIYDFTPKNLNWLVIQNSYFHDYFESDEIETGFWRNHDAILIHSPSDGIIFNNYCENWVKADSCFDIGHRRNDQNYNQHAFRAERNIVKNSPWGSKIVGLSNENVKIIFTNNLYVNSTISDYHKNYTAYRVHETYIYDTNSEWLRFLALWGIDGDLIFENNLVYKELDRIKGVYWEGGTSQEGDYFNIIPNYNSYLINPPQYWVAMINGSRIFDFEDWQNLGKDINSSFITPENCFINYNQSNFNLNSNCSIIGKGNKDYINNEIPLRVNKDFKGTSRINPSPGAFESLG